MHCIILAGGFATRLRPLTKTLPKALLPIKGRALVDYVYDDVCAQEDISSTTVVSNELYFPLFKRHFLNAFPERKINVISNGVSTNETRKGAIGDLLYAIQTQKLHTHDLLVVSSDTYSSLKMQDFIRFYKQFKEITTVAFDGHDAEKIKGKLGCITLKKNRITEFIEKPEKPSTTLMAIPYYIFPKTRIPLLIEFGKTGHGDSPGLFISWALSRVPIYAFNMGTGKYFDIGTPELYEEAKAKI